MSSIVTPSYQQSPTEDNQNQENQTPKTSTDADGSTGSQSQQSYYVSSQPRKASSGFTNLKSYLGANQNNNLGTNLANEAQQKIDTSKANLNTAYTGFQNDLADQKAKIATSTQNAKDALGYLDTGTAQNRIAVTDVTDPTLQKAAYNTNASDALTAANNQNFTASKNLNDIQNVAQDKVGLNDFADQSAKESGRGAILQQKYGQTGNYTGGMRNLDNLMLSNDKSALDKLRDIRLQTRNYSNDIDNKQNQAQIQNAGATADLGNQKSYINKTSTDLYDNLKQRLVDQASSYNAAQHANADTIDNSELDRLLGQVGYTPQGPYSTQITLPVMRNGQMTPTETLDSPTTTIPKSMDWIDLTKNSLFAPEQQYNPNKTYTQQTEEAGFLPWEDNTLQTKTSINNNQINNPVLVAKDALRKYFTQSYNDTDWTGIDADTLARRNALNQFLGDKAPDGGAITATDKNTVQDVIDQENIDNLKSIPKSGIDKFGQTFSSKSNEDANIRNMLDNPAQYDFKQMGPALIEKLKTMTPQERDALSKEVASRADEHNFWGNGSGDWDPKAMTDYQLNYMKNNPTDPTVLNYIAPLFADKNLENAFNNVTLDKQPGISFNTPNYESNSVAELARNKTIYDQLIKAGLTPAQINIVKGNK